LRLASHVHFDPKQCQGGDMPQISNPRKRVGIGRHESIDKRRSIILIDPAIARLAISICCRNDDDQPSLARSAGCDAAAIAQIVAKAASMRIRAEAYAAGEEGLMNRAPSANAVRSVRKNSRKRISYNEDANEASSLVRDEAVDPERETADRGNQAIERTEPNDGSNSPAFEE
jgi:hypothetical protein